MTFGVPIFVLIIVIPWNHWQASKSLSWLAFEVFLCLYFRVTRRFMLRMQHEFNTTHCSARMLLFSEKLMSCCATGTNGCLDLRRRATALDGRVSAEWNRCPGSMARRFRDSVAPLRRSSADWIPARIGRLFPGVGRRPPVTIRRASLMMGSVRRVWALRHQTGAQYSTVEWTRARVAVCNVVAPASQLEPASRLRSDVWC